MANVLLAYHLLPQHHLTMGRVLHAKLHFVKLVLQVVNQLVFYVNKDIFRTA